MADIKTLVEEAKELAHNAADPTEYLHIRLPRIQAAWDAIDALAEAHQAEVARLQDELRIIAGKRSLEADRCDTLVGEVARLTRENEGLAKDAGRLKEVLRLISLIHHDTDEMIERGLSAVCRARAAFAGASEKDT